MDVPVTQCFVKVSESRVGQDRDDCGISLHPFLCYVQWTYCRLPYVFFLYLYLYRTLTLYVYCVLCMCVVLHERPKM